MSKILLVLLGLFLFPVVQAESFSVKLLGGKKVEVRKNTQKKIYVINAQVNRFEVNCEKSFMVVSGIVKGKKLGETDLSKVVLINIDQQKEVASFTTGAGIFNTDFLKKGNLKINEAYLINLNTGKINFPDTGTYDEKPESCDVFRYKYYGKISEDGEMMINP
jgi:hypothetical protein